jgi:preprotein translocase subunit SecA
MPTEKERQKIYTQEELFSLVEDIKEQIYKQMDSSLENFAKTIEPEPEKLTETEFNLFMSTINSEIHAIKETFSETTKELTEQYILNAIEKLEAELNRHDK